MHDESDDESHDELDKSQDELDELHNELDEVHDELDELHDELDKHETDELDEQLDKDTVQLIASMLLLEEASEFNPVTDSNEHELEESLHFF